MPKNHGEQRDHRRRRATDSADQPAEGHGSDNQLGSTRGEKDVQAGPLTCSWRSRFPVSHQARTNVGSQCPVKTHQARCPQAGHGLGELAGIATLLCDLAGRSGRRSEAVQAQMRHSRLSTTMDIYAQFVPAAQRRAVAQMMDMVSARLAKASPASVSVN